jgi:hypothetical protein
MAESGARGSRAGTVEPKLEKIKAAGLRTGRRRGFSAQPSLDVAHRFTPLSVAC